MIGPFRASLSLSRFILLYVALYGAFGVSSPFLPSFLAEHGLEPEAIGLVLAVATTVRLAAGPLAGRTADRLGMPRAVLVGCAAAAALITFGYLPAHGLLPLLLVSMAHAAVLAPLPPLSDALALRASVPWTEAGHHDRGFRYGWVRGAGSAAFILGALGSGQFIAQSGLNAIIWLNGALLVLATLCAFRVPDRFHQRSHATAHSGTHGQGVLTLLRMPRFRRLVLAAALILGSHAMHDSFVVIHWRNAGISPGTISLLWSESVAAEVVVFLALGAPLLHALGSAGALTLAAAAGILRWTVLAQTSSVAAGALVEPLHGLTFALQHLAAMRLLTELVPPHLAATAQTLYATVGVGAASALMTLASGPLYERFGADGFWVMGVLCALALPVVHGLRSTQERSGTEH